MMPRPRKATRSRSAMSATSGGLDPQPITGAQRTGGLRGDLLAVHEVAPARSRLAAVRPARGVAPPLGYERPAHLGERLQLANDAVAASLRARAARAAPHRVLHGTQRKLELER